MLKILKRNIGALKARFEKGDTDPEFLRNLAMLTIYEDANFSGKVTKKYFEVKSDKAFFSGRYPVAFIRINEYRRSEI